MIVNKNVLYPIDLCLYFFTVYNKIAFPCSYAKHFMGYIRPLCLRYCLERLVNQLALGKANIKRNKE